MINGAKQVIAGIPGVHLDPFLLADSQNGDTTGYIMIAYQQQFRTFDLLFLHGSTVVDCARINPDHRFPINLAMAKAMFLHSRETSLVFLYQCPPADVERFLTTFHSEPCLKVHVNAISGKQIRSLINATGCRNGIVERNNFLSTPPEVELAELSFPGPLPRFKTGLKQGRLLLYDLQKNLERGTQRPLHAEPPPTLLTRPRRKTGIKVLPADPDVNSTENIVPVGLPDPPAAKTAKEDDLEDFDALIKQILSTPLSTNPDSPPRTGNGRKSRRKSTIATKAGEKENESNDNTPRGDAESSAPTGDSSPEADRPTQPMPASETSPPTPEPSQQAEDGNYIRQFQRLFRSFRQQAFECFGPRCETIAAEAERQVRFLSPEFDMNNLCADTAASILDVIEAMIERAPFLKRSRLRTAALTLVADLYNKQYDLLEAYNAIDKVEQHYYRLKK